MYRSVTIQITNGGEISAWSPPELAIHPGAFCIVVRGDIQEYACVMEMEEKDALAPGGREAARLLRRATLQDQSRAEENVLHGKMAMKTCAQIAERLGLHLRLVRGHYSFDRSVLMVEFTSEDRLDLRELSRHIGDDLRTRVDLKQLGVRDEAAIIGGMGPCGRQLCCSSWIKRFASINVKMAKTQGLSLNPSAIGGCCGRLKCCLSYENDAYRELARHVPPKGAMVQCPDGRACVEERNLLRQQVRVRLEDGRVMECRADEVRGIWRRGHGNRSDANEDSGDERSEFEPAGDEGAGSLRDDDAGPDHGPCQDPRYGPRH